MSNNSNDADSNNKGISELKLRRKWAEVSVYVIFFAINILYLMEALDLPESLRGVGPGGFPIIISLFIGTSLLMLFIVSMKQEEGGDFVIINRPVQVALVIAAITSIVISLQWIGPVFSITFLAFLVMWFGGERRFIFLITLPPLLSISIYILFVMVLGVYFD